MPRKQPSTVIWTLLLFAAFLAFAFPSADAQGFKHRRNKHSITCYLGSYAAFWENDGAFVDFIYSHLRPIGPSGLNGYVRVAPKSVDVHLDFDDNSYQYAGQAPTFTDDGKLATLGGEWLGIDDLFEAVATKVMQEAVSPDTNNVLNPDVLKYLGGPTRVSLVLSLQVGADEIGKPAGGMVYEGEFQSYHPGSDTLKIPIVFDERDTMACFAIGQQLNEFELVSLKAFAMQERAKSAVLQQFGDDDSNVDELPGFRRGPHPITWRTPRILSNHPNQPAYLLTSVSIKFGSRGPFTSKDGIEVR